MTDHLMTTVDLFPTFLELLDDADAPDDLDGESFLDVLQGQASRTERTLYWHYPHYHVGSGMVPAGAIRRGKYKFIEWFEGTVAGAGRKYELFDLAEDISESRDLTGSRPEIAEQLRADLAAWRARVGAQMPTPNPRRQHDTVH